MDYQAGGGLPPGANSYVTRRADDELFAGLKKGEFCYVLNSRQMGKTSLRFEVQRRLRAEGIVCAMVDLQSIGSAIEKPEQWYTGVVSGLVETLPEVAQRVNWRQWWKANDLLTPMQRLGEFIRVVVLPAFPQQKVVLLIDEIDSVLSLPFKLDDFFGLLRSCYQESHGDAQQITFALFGVATPSGLVSSGVRSPFNIGRAIPLDGFTFAEAAGLAAGLAAQAQNPEETLKEILRWTGGQPFLTQKLCELVQDEEAGEIATGEESLKISQLVQRCVVENWEAQDEPQHLRTVRDRILGQGDKLAGRLLGVYQQVWRQGSVSVKAVAKEEMTELRLSGLLVKQGDVLTISNPIYKAVFNERWIEEALGALRSDLYVEAFKAWLDSDRKNESVLLRGQMLQAALDWKNGKLLSREDEAFLEASVALSQRETQRRLAIEQEEKARLAEANRTAGQRLAFGSFFLISSLVAASVLLFVARVAQNERNIVREGTAIERLANDALRKIEQDPYNAFITSLRAGQRLQALNKKNGIDWISQYPTITPLLALQQTQSDIGLPPQVLKHDDQVNNAVFSPDGEHIVTASVDGIARIWTVEGQLIGTLEGHMDSINHTTFSPNGEYIITASNDGTAGVWTDKGQLVTTLEGHRDSIEYAAFSPNGRHIVTASRDSTARLWTVEGQLIATLEGHERGIGHVAFSPDGKYIITSSWDRTARIWVIEEQSLTRSNDLQGDIVHSFNRGVTEQQDLEARITSSSQDESTQASAAPGQLVAILEHPPTVSGTLVNYAAFSPDSGRIVTAATDGAARIWTNEGQLIATLEGHRPFYDDSEDIGALHVDFSPNGERIVMASYDGSVRLWTAEGQLIVNLEGHESSVKHAAFSPDGEYIVTASTDGTARLWTAEGQSVSTLKGHGDSVEYADFSPNGERIVTASADGTVKIWTVFSQQYITTFEGHEAGVLHAAFSPDGGNIVTASKDGTARVWAASGQLISVLRGYTDFVLHAAFSPDGERIVTAAWNNQVHIWKISGEIIATLRHMGDISYAEFSPNGQLVVTASTDHTARVWTASGQLVATLEGHESILVHAAFSPDGESIVTTSDDGTARVWTASGKLVSTLEGHDAVVWHAAFSPDGESIVTASKDNTARVWTASGQLVSTLEGHDAGVWHAAFSPDGKSIVTASKDNTARVWTASGQLVSTLEGHDAGVLHAAFSPDGKSIVTASKDNTARVWTASGQLVSTLEGHEDQVVNAVFSPDGEYIITASEDGTARLWPVQTLDQLVAESCTWLHTYYENGNTVSDSDLALCDIPP